MKMDKTSKQKTEREHENKIWVRKNVCNNEHKNNVKWEVMENGITNVKEDVKTAAKIQKENMLESIEVSDTTTEHTTISKLGMNIDRKNIEEYDNTMI